MDAGLGQREGGIFRRDDEVAGQRDLEAAAHRDAVDGGDDRLVAVEPRGEAGKAALVPAALASGSLPFQVVAGAERLVAGAGDDRDPLFGVGGKIVEHLVELEMRVDMQRIVHFGPRQRDDRDRTLARHLGEFQIHVGSRSIFCGEEYGSDTTARSPSATNPITQAPRACQALFACLTWLDLGPVFQP
jgi:hypothetical protein